MEASRDVKLIAKKIIDNFYIGKRDEENINDREVVKAMTDIAGKHFWKAGDEIRNDRNVYMKVLEKDGQGIMGANGSFMRSRQSKMADDREAAFLAADTYRNVLEHVSERLQNDKELVLKMGRIYGDDSLYYAGESMRADPDLAKVILRRNWISINIPLGKPSKRKFSSFNRETCVDKKTKV